MTIHSFDSHKKTFPFHPISVTISFIFIIIQQPQFSVLENQTLLVDEWKRGNFFLNLKNRGTYYTQEVSKI